MDCITNTVAIVAAIFIAEGGDRARVPYGILSVKPDDKTVLVDPARHEA